MTDHCTACPFAACEGCRYQPTDLGDTMPARVEIPLDQIDTTKWDEWNAANKRARDTYQAERGNPCKTCGGRREPDRTECWSCRSERYAAAQ